MLLEMNQVRVEVQGFGGSKILLNLSNLTVASGESVGVVGETGSGKTMTSLAITRLFPSSAISLVEGDITFDGRQLSRLPMKDIERLRGREIGMIFQDPSTSLNPVFRVGRILTDLVRQHHKVGKREARRRAIELLKRVELPHPEEMAERYPFELSGGQRQRVLIAMSLVGRPKLLIADEPTTALDVTVQAGILKLLRRLQQEEGLSMLVITHNIGLVAHMTERIYVMYQGKVVETGLTIDVLTHPRHPYTQMLLQSIPRWETRRQRLMTVPVKAHAHSSETGTIEEQPPAMNRSLAHGCAFAPRCPMVMDSCWNRVPVLNSIPDGKTHVACLRMEAQTHADADS